VHGPPLRISCGGVVLRAFRPLLRNHLRHVGRVPPLLYQFEAIHLFTDGNGRTGRILNSLFLVERGRLSLPILYPSRYIVAHRDEHYALLRGVTVERAWEPWILYMLDAITQTSYSTLAKVEAIGTLMTETAKDLRARAPKLNGGELIEIMFERALLPHRGCHHEVPGRQANGLKVAERTGGSWAAHEGAHRPRDGLRPSPRSEALD